MKKEYLWQNPDFPHFYYNPAVVEPLEEAFRQDLAHLDAKLEKQVQTFEDVLTEEIISNSEIEGVVLDRDSVYSSFVHNIAPTSEKESGAVGLTKMALANYAQPLSHELLQSMHQEILRGSTSFPDQSVGTYVGDMKIVSGRRLDQEFNVIHEGVSRELVHQKMTEFIDWYNRCTNERPLVNAVQGHIHFETLHPFCDGNGRIGRSLILMGLCRDLDRNTPLALSRSFNLDLKNYYRQFEGSLDLTETIRSVAPLFMNSVRETSRILELTAYRTNVSDHKDVLNTRQFKALNRLIEYELRGGFKGGLTNAKYQKMTGITDRTALRDLSQLEEQDYLVKIGKLKGTRYYLNIPHLIKRLESSPS